MDYGGQRPLFPGQSIIPQWPAEPRKDLKSGALLLPYRPGTEDK